MTSHKSQNKKDLACDSRTSRIPLASLFKLLRCHDAIGDRQKCTFKRRMPGECKQLCICVYFYLSSLPTPVVNTHARGEGVGGLIFAWVSGQQNRWENVEHFRKHSFGLAMLRYFDCVTHISPQSEHLCISFSEG